MADDSQDLREFMRELIARMERSEREHVAALREMLREHRDGMAEIKHELKALQQELRDHRGEWREAQHEMYAEQRASRAALFRMLDRLGPGSASA